MVKSMQSVGEHLWAAEVYLGRCGVADSKREVELLMEHLLGLSRAGVYLALNKPFPKADAFWSLVERRGKREPTGYLTGIQGFWSLDLETEPGVFIPRRETEHLVEEALSFLRSRIGPKILDLATGSGPIALALANDRVDVEVWGVDVCPRAVDLAQRNKRKHGIDDQVRFFCGHLFGPLPGKEMQFDLVVSNPPYISSSEWERLEAEVRLWEPPLAVRGGRDGMRFYPEILKGGLRVLKPGGAMILEIGARQAEGVRKIVHEVGGYEKVAVKKDYSGHDRVVVARRERNHG